MNGITEMQEYGNKKKNKKRGSKQKQHGVDRTHFIGNKLLTKQLVIMRYINKRKRICSESAPVTQIQKIKLNNEY